MTFAMKLTLTLSTLATVALLTMGACRAEGSAKPYEIKAPNGDVYVCQDIGKLTVCAAK